MEYFSLTKTDKKCTLEPITFKGGFSFKQRMTITVFNVDIIRYILMKKLDNSLKNIINLYLLYDEDEDGGESVATLLPKVESLRAILIEKYALYLKETEIEAYLIKFEKLEEKIGSRMNRRSRSL